MSRGLFFSTEKKRESSTRKSMCLQHRIVSAVKRVERVSDRMSYIVLRGRWRNIIVLNVADINVLGRSVHIIKKNTEALVAASKEIGLEAPPQCHHMFL